MSTLEEQELGNREKYVQLLFLVSHSGPDGFEFTDLSNSDGNIDKLPVTICKYLIEQMGGSVKYQVNEERKTFVIKMNTKVKVLDLSIKTLVKPEGQERAHLLEPEP